MGQYGDDENVQPPFDRFRCTEEQDAVIDNLSISRKDTNATQGTADSVFDIEAHSIQIELLQNSVM